MPTLCVCTCHKVSLCLLSENFITFNIKRYSFPTKKKIGNKVYSGDKGDISSSKHSSVGGCYSWGTDLLFYLALKPFIRMCQSSTGYHTFWTRMYRMLCVCSVAQLYLTLGNSITPGKAHQTLVCTTYLRASAGCLSAGGQEGIENPMTGSFVFNLFLVGI